MGSGTGSLTLEVIVLVAGGLLVPAGVAKLRHPAIARDALNGRWIGDRVVRLVGAGELLLAAWVLLLGGRAATGALAATYLAFTTVALRQRRRGGSCGCFGAATAPTGRSHVAFNALAAAAAAAAAAVAPTLGAVTVVRGAGPIGGPTLFVAGAVAVASAQLVLTTLPDLAAARRRTTLGVRR